MPVAPAAWMAYALAGVVIVTAAAAADLAFAPYAWKVGTANRHIPATVVAHLTILSMLLAPAAVFYVCASNAAHHARLLRSLDIERAAEAERLVQQRLQTELATIDHDLVLTGMRLALPAAGARSRAGGGAAGRGDGVPAGRASARRHRCARRHRRAGRAATALHGSQRRQLRRDDSMSHEARAVIAEDERLLAQGLRDALAELWPELRDLRRGRGRHPGAARARRTRARHPLPRHPDAGVVGDRGGAPGQRTLPRRLRDRLRRIRGPGVRARRGRLRAEAAVDGAARHHGRPPQEVPSAARRRASTGCSSGSRSRAKAAICAGSPRRKVPRSG